MPKLYKSNTWDKNINSHIVYINETVMCFLIFMASCNLSVEKKVTCVMCLLYIVPFLC